MWQLRYYTLRFFAYYSTKLCTESKIRFRVVDVATLNICRLPNCEKGTTVEDGSFYSMYIACLLNKGKILMAYLLCTYNTININCFLDEKNVFFLTVYSR